MTKFQSPFSLSAERYSTFTRVTLLVLIQLTLLAWLFRANLANGFSFVLGDRYDNLIEISILEHWYNVLRGLEHWAVTAYFFPYPKTLGYNDGYLLYGVIYSLFRALNVDPFLASMLVNISMKAATFALFFLFARKVLQTGFWYAAFGAAVFEVSNNIVVHSMHAQLLTVAFVPLCAMLLYFAGRALLQNDERKVLACGAGFAACFGLWAMTSYYMLWFFSFFTVLALLFFVLIRPVYLLRQVLALRARTVLAAVAALVLLALALLPFLLVYLPKASETGMHSYSAAFSYLLQPYDILNIGEHNYLYGRFLPALHEAIGFPIQFSENQMGLPPVLLLVFLCGGFLALRNVRDVRAQLILILTLAALALWVLALKVGDQSGWYWIYHYFPGAKAVRVVSRSMIFLVFPVLCVALYFLSSFKGRSAWLLILPCCALLVAEELNWLGAVHLERAAAVRMLESVPRAPADCRSFFVQDMRPPGPLESAGEREYYRHNVEAMLIAEYIHLPTVNGYSSFNPPDWNFNAADRPDYAARVAAYSKVHQIQGLCALDLQTRSWSLPGR